MRIWHGLRQLPMRQGAGRDEDVGSSGSGLAPSGQNKKQTGMTGVMDRAGVGCRGLGGSVLLLSVLLAGCGEVGPPEAIPTDGAPAQLSIEEAIAAIQAATPNPVRPEQVAETFAFGTNATDVQREMMEKDLVGSVVEWDLVVYEVEFADGKYQVTSQPIPVQSADAFQLVSVVAWVQAQSPADDAFLRSVKTGDPIRIRGLVQGIFLRTMVRVGPGVVVGTAT
jgi:hypothetical protein